MKVIIAGSRAFSDYELLKKKCDQILDGLEVEIEIVSGTAPGADRLGERYAHEKGYKLKRMPAQWDQYQGRPTEEIGFRKHGDMYWKRAGMVRNREMAEYADAAIIFWDGKSKGTKNMIYWADKLNLITSIINYET